MSKPKRKNYTHPILSEKDSLSKTPRVTQTQPCPYLLICLLQESLHSILPV
jgi:hypothetical protein